MALAVAFSLVAALGFATGSILVRVATQRVSAPTATTLAVMAGAVVAAGLALALDLSEIGKLPLEAFGWFAVLGLMGYPIARLLNYISISTVGASGSAPVGSLSPLIAVGLAVVLLNERPGLLVSLGTPVIVFGLVLVVMGATRARVVGQSGGNKGLGYLAAFGSASAFGGRDVVSRHVVSGVAPPLVASAFALSTGAAMLLVLTHRDLARSFRRVPWRYLALCVAAGTCQGLASVSVFQALSRAPVAVVSPIYASSPLFTLVLAHLFLQRLEAITWPLVIGTSLSVAGVVLVVVGAAL
jgi:drug/metabolite transporter (DMT)-like permease